MERGDCMDDYTVFYMVQINTLFLKTGFMITDFRKIMSELTEHLSMNGYTFDTNGDDRIFIYEEELSYLLTILDDRDLLYMVL